MKKVFRVLIVDDQHEVRRMLASGVKTLGEQYDVLEVPSAEEAMLVSAGLPLDLVVTDVRLPGISGLDLVARLQKRRPDLRTILITGAMDSKTRRQVSESSASAYFYKPLMMDEFLGTVERLCTAPPEAAAAAGQPAAPVVEAPVEAPPPAKKQRPPEPKPKPPAWAAELVEQARREEEARPVSLPERLAALRQEFHAQAALLLDDSGVVMAEAGDLPEIVQDPALLSALMATFSASLKVSHALGAEKPDNLLCFAGQKHQLCLLHVGSGHALLLAAGDLLLPDRLAAIRQAMPATLKELEQIMEKLGMEMLAQRDEPALAPADLQNIPLDAEVLAGVDALFGKAAAAKPKDADAFWDTVAEESDLGAGSDSLTYEQARQLGLAPGEEEK